jgi:hypothetical protein
MNFKIYKTGFLASVLLCITACSIDDIQPINQFTEEIVISNESSANAVLNKIYNAHRSFNITSMAAATGFYGPTQNEARGLFGGTGFSDNNVQDDSGLLNSIYSELYGTINDANFFIDLVEAGNAVGLAEARKNEMLAEARFFRAMAHFTLLRVFGEFYDTSSQYGVVTSLSPIRSADDKFARNTVQETYDAIIADLQYAVNNAGAGRDHIYVTATTAQGLLAKVQLYMGDYTGAATNALAVINNGDGYALEPVYADIYSKRWESSEVLFAPFVDGFNEGSAWTETQFSTATVSVVSQLFKDVADASDGALDASDVSGIPFAGYDSRFLFAYSFTTRGQNGNGKYPFFSRSSDGGEGNTFYYLRMAEVYLIHAEAEARRSGGDLMAALDRLNDIRNRAGMPVKTLTDQATLLEDIRNEKMIELGTENAEAYYDLVRYDRLGDLETSTFKASLTDDKHIFPIPAAALAGNELLVPNPNQ